MAGTGEAPPSENGQGLNGGATGDRNRLRQQWAGTIATMSNYGDPTGRNRERWQTVWWILGGAAVLFPALYVLVRLID